MVDPLLVLGAAASITSLIIQIMNECIKGFKFYNKAAQMPESYHYLHVCLQIKQQRFLNFGLESGILYVDGVICAILQINQSLLLAVLTEIKTALETYTTVNGKYKGLMPQEIVNWANYKEPQMGLMDLLCPPPQLRSQGVAEHAEKRKLSYLKHACIFGKSVAQTGRNLQTIIMEPKCLVWAAIDKESFESLISKLEHLNSFLIALLDSSQIQQLQDVMSTMYLEVLQIHNDMESLVGLVKALYPTAPNPQNYGASAIGADSDSLFWAIAQEMEAHKRKKKYFKQLVEVKIQHTRMDQLASESSPSSRSSKFIGALLKLDEFGFIDKDLNWDPMQKWVNTIYQSRSVWVEWKHIPNSGSLTTSSKQIKYQIGLLTGLLCYKKPVGFRAPSCLGYIKNVDGDNGAQFGIVFDNPANECARFELFTLWELYKQRSKPSLSAHILMCAILAQCIHSFYAVNWLHKGLQSSNIIFFTSSATGQDLSRPFVSGFELSHLSTVDKMTEKPMFDPFADIYCHPDAQSSQMDSSYRKSYNIYSLGIVLIEIAFWKRIENIMRIESRAKIKPSALREVQPWLLGKPFSQSAALPHISLAKGPCLQQVAPECSDAFCDVIKYCLTTSNVEKLQYLGESQLSIALRLQNFMEQDIVKRLKDIADSLQGHI